MRITELGDLTIGNCIVWKIGWAAGNPRVYYYIKKLNDSNLEAYKLAPVKRTNANAVTLFDYTELFEPDSYNDEVYDSFESARMQYPEDFI